MASLVILAPAMDKIVKIIFFPQVFIYRSHGKMTFPSALAGKVGKACANAFQVILCVCLAITQTYLKKYLSVNYFEIAIVSLKFEMRSAPEVLTAKPVPDT